MTNNQNYPLLFNLPNNFLNETTIALKKRKREDNKKNRKWNDVVVIDDVPNEVVDSENNDEQNDEDVIIFSMIIARVCIRLRRTKVKSKVDESDIKLAKELEIIEEEEVETIKTMVKEVNFQIGAIK
ncbi:hypothetical protein Tco_1477604 [Tanacetum coccineum]